jgi:small-conductance mechanosensitive channel
MDPSIFDGSLLQQTFQHPESLIQNHVVRRLFIVLIYAVLAKVADLFVDRLLKRLAGRTKITADDKIIGVLHLPICYSILLFGILHAIHIPPPLIAPLDLVLVNLTKTLMLLLWWTVIIRNINLMNETSMAGFMKKRRIDMDLFLLVKNISRVLILFAGLAWLLIIWDVDLTPLFASAGIAGIAIALAAKDTMANFFGGISLFADRAYKVGDYIILDNAQRGEVMEMGIRSTKIKTRDDVMISIPNSILANSMIINESAPKPRFRIRVDIGVAYGSDLRKVEKILLKVAEENETLARKPEPRVRVRAFGDSSVNFQLLVWVQDPSERGLQTHNLLKATYKAFENEGITIPFPQRDVHLVQEFSAAPSID